MYIAILILGILSCVMLAIILLSQIALCKKANFNDLNELKKYQEDLKKCQEELKNCQDELKKSEDELAITRSSLEELSLKNEKLNQELCVLPDLKTQLDSCEKKLLSAQQMTADYEKRFSQFEDMQTGAEGGMQLVKDIIKLAKLNNLLFQIQNAIENVNMSDYNSLVNAMNGVRYNIQIYSKI